MRGIVHLRRQAAGSFSPLSRTTVRSTRGPAVPASAHADSSPTGPWWRLTQPRHSILCRLALAVLPSTDAAAFFSIRHWMSRLQVFLGAGSTERDWLTRDHWPSDVVTTFNAAGSTYFSLWPICYDCEDPLAEAVSVRLSHGAPPAPIPEPATITLLSLCLAAIGTRRWRQQRSC
jgi:hypothetical protein